MSSWMIVEESLDPFNSKIFKGEKTFVRVDVVGDTSKCVTIFEAKGKFNKDLNTIWPFLVPGHICGYFYEAKIDKNEKILPSPCGY